MLKNSQSQTKKYAFNDSPNIRRKYTGLQLRRKTMGNRINTSIFDQDSNMHTGGFNLSHCEYIAEECKKKKSIRPERWEILLTEESASKNQVDIEDKETFEELLETGEDISSSIKISSIKSASQLFFNELLIRKIVEGKTKQKSKFQLLKPSVKKDPQPNICRLKMSILKKRINFPTTCLEKRKHKGLLEPQPRKDSDKIFSRLRIATEMSSPVCQPNTSQGYSRKRKNDSLAKIVK